MSLSYDNSLRQLAEQVHVILQANFDLLSGDFVDVSDGRRLLLKHSGN